MPPAPRRRSVSSVVAALVLAGACAGHARPSLPHVNHAAEQTLAADLGAIFDDPATSSALWGIEVRSLGTGRTLYARNPRTLVMPASNLKILTLSAAAETLGWDHRFATRLETRAAIENGALRGDLIIKGGGDPTINERGHRAATVFDAWAAALKAAGVSRIDGNIVADARAFDRSWLGAGWAWDYLQDDYASPVGALEFDEDNATLTVTAGPAEGAAATIALAEGSGLRLDSGVTTGAPGATTSIEMRREPGDAVLHVSGTIAADAAPQTREAPVLNPAVYFAQGTRDALIARGIVVAGAAVDVEDMVPVADAAEPSRLLVETASPPLRDIAATMMKVSQNLYAETLFKSLGMIDTTAASADGGRAAVKSVLAKWGVGDGGYVEYDGSGLSRYDFVSADLIVSLLTHLYNDPRHRDAFMATLPIAGIDGTLRSRMKQTAAENNARAKTGSIANVRALSGFVNTADGDTLVFSMIVNNFTAPALSVTALADRAVVRLAEFSERNRQGRAGQRRGLNSQPRNSATPK